MIAKSCANCVYCRARKPSDSTAELKARNYGFWCAINGMATEPGLLRCGGDDFDQGGKPLEEKTARAFPDGRWDSVNPGEQAGRQ